MNDQDKAKAIERANSYRAMMDMWGWKDFQKFLDETRSSALESAIGCDEMKDIQEWRGQVKCVDAILSHLGYILNGTV